MINYYSIFGKSFNGCWKDTALYKNKSSKIMIKCGEYYNGQVVFCHDCKYELDLSLEKFTISKLEEQEKKE